MYSLVREMEYYEHFNYNTGNHVTDVVFCDSNEWLEGYREDEPQAYTILKTPFDWTGMDKPYWWGEPEEKRKKNHPEKVRSYEELIAWRETNTSRI